MSEVPTSHRRKRGINLYLRNDLVEALERVAADTDLSVSRVVEILLGFCWELNEVAEEARSLAEVNRQFRRTLGSSFPKT